MKEVVFAIFVCLAALASDALAQGRAPLPEARFKRINGHPALVVNGKVHTTMHYWVANPDTTDQIDNCRKNGMHVYWLMLDETPWRPGDEFDFSQLDSDMAKLLKIDPDALVFISIALDNQLNRGLQPWVDSHPNELVRDATGSTMTPDYGSMPNKAPSMASLEWQSMSESLLRKLVRYVKGSSYADRIIGYIYASGVSYEWQQWASVAWPPVYVDYAEPARKAFAEWLKAKYRTVDKLNAAWKCKLASFDDVKIPTVEERTSTDVFTFLDPRKSRREIDFRRYYSETVAGAIIRMAEAIKEESGGKSICGVFYGYVMHVLGPYRYQLIGHSALHKVLKSPYLDMLISPSDYADREIGGGSGFMSAVDSVRLHGKVWLDEADIRTHHSPLPERVTTIEESKAAMLRHFGYTIAADVSEQWYDFSAGWTAGDPELMKLAGKLREVEQRLLNTHRKRLTDHSIAVIVDEQSTDYTAMSTWAHWDAAYLITHQLTRMGVGFDSYLLDDIDRIPDYKCYVFLNTFRITRKQRAIIEKRLKRDGKTLVFMFAPGITDGNRLSTNLVSEVTELKMDVLNRELVPRLKIITEPSGIVKYCPTGFEYDYGGSVGPILIPRDGKVLGNLVGADNAPGLALKKNDDWTCVFSVVPCIPFQLLRGIAETAGVRVTNKTDGDITYIGDGIVAIHTLKGGPRELRMGKPGGTATDLLTDRKLKVDADGLLRVELPPRSTTLYLAE